MKYKILIIEDELLIAKDISFILESKGYVTKYGIKTAEEAIIEIQNNNYDLVLIDIHLKDNSDGILVGSYLLNKNIIPYIYITSYSDKESIERIKLTRPHGIIIKPFKLEDIITNTSIVLSNFYYSNINVFSVNDELNYKIPFLLKDVCDYIDLNINKKINMQELTSLTKWSKQHFLKLFTDFIGQSPYQYILYKKIEKAKKIIKESDVKLSYLALDLGFESYSNFFLAFKKQTGCTPDCYRKMNQIKK